MPKPNNYPDSVKQPTRRLYALEITGKHVAQIEAAQAVIPQGTPINIAFLGNENHSQRINAAKVIRACGFEPVPIISSRRLHSEDDRDYLLSTLIAEASPQRFILVGGDPSAPAGTFQDSLSLLKSNILQRHSIRHLGIVGYPEGHPKINTQTLWRALKWKQRFLKEADCSVEITTQFGFDADAVVEWIKRLRDEGIEDTVRIGLPGPADTGTLLRYARQFGVTPSATIARGYGMSMTNLAQHIGPERYWDRLTTKISAHNLGPILYHLYPFGGIREGVDWMNARMANRLPQGSTQK